MSALVRQWTRGIALGGVLALCSCAHQSNANPGGSAMNDGLFEVRNISVSILRSPKEVYAFTSNGENLSRWASGLGRSVRQADGEWIADGPLGHIVVRFAPPNDLGVLDHDAVLPSGATVHNPMRVVPNGSGSTVIFTLLRLPGVSEAKFAEDAKWVEKDLTTLKGLLDLSP
jgi:hypothetical protein